MSNVYGLFAGIGGMELGLRSAGHLPSRFVENWKPAIDVLKAQFGHVTLGGDIAKEPELGDGALIVTAGFPCTDLSSAGRSVGITGEASGLVSKALELTLESEAEWLLFENVPQMLTLHSGAAIELITSELEAKDWSWAYRTIDSRSFGVPQRRRRVYLLASPKHDPRAVLFREDAGEPDASVWKKSTYGFYWTEGNRGVGWAQDALPTLKGGTTANVPSPPAVWRPRKALGGRIVTPTIEVLEEAQGFPPEWTEAAPARARWKLVGNAVTTFIPQWVGDGINEPDAGAADGYAHVILAEGDKWPRAAFGKGKTRYGIEISEWPVRTEPIHIADLLDKHGSNPLSVRATTGFRSRLAKSRLRQRNDERFMRDLQEHVDFHS